MTLEEYKKKKNKNDGKGFIYLTKLMITILITITTLLILKIKPDLKSSFQEKLTYSSISKYKDGSSLKVTSSYLVPILEDGMIIYTGEKEDYGLTVIIEQANGIEVWYSNLKNYRVKLYDYVEKGTLLGEVDNELYIVIKKDGKYLNYEEVF